MASPWIATLSLLCTHRPSQSQTITWLPFDMHHVIIISCTITTNLVLFNSLSKRYYERTSERLSIMHGTASSVSCSSSSSSQKLFAPFVHKKEAWIGSLFLYSLCSLSLFFTLSLLDTYGRNVCTINKVRSVEWIF